MKSLILNDSIQPITYFLRYLIIFSLTHISLAYYLTTWLCVNASHCFVQSLTHTTNVSKMFGMEDTCGVAPSADDMKTLISDIRAGGSFRTLGAARRWHNMAEHKISKVVWCFAEALKQRWRVFLMMACTINLLRDERHKRLQIRFRAAGPLTGEIMCGWFGIGCWSGGLGLWNGFGGCHS